MIINKHTNKNHYLRTDDGLWVRDFTKPYTKAIDINKLTKSPVDCHMLLSNELRNIQRGAISIDVEILDHPNIVIVSDGLNFAERHKILAKLPRDVVIMGVNGALAKWQLMLKDCPTESKRIMSCYIVNNPYVECMHYLPKKHAYYPQCIASLRTHPAFLDGYRGNIALYSPAPSEYYAGPRTAPQYFVDDYRNPLCAAIGLAYRFHVKKLLLLCCDNSFPTGRPGSTSLKNGLQCYPQQCVSQRVIDGNLHWLKLSSVEIADCSDGISYNNAKYIPEAEIEPFFREEGETQ